MSFECHCGESFDTPGELVEHLDDYGLMFVEDGLISVDDLQED